MTVENKCEICGVNESIGAVASMLGPVSNAICRTCLHNRAEFVGMFEYIHEAVGDDVADHVKTLSTYVDGKYLTWDEWVETQ